MFKDESLFQAVLDEPDDVVCRSAYADWLQEKGDPRGDYLRLLLDIQALPHGDLGIAECRSRTRALQPTLDRHWVSIIDDFDARVREVRTIRLKIRTYGPAPKKYPKAVKVGIVPRVLLQNAGWEHVGDGKSYSYLRPPAGAKAADPVIPVEVPTDAELGRLAESFRRKGESDYFCFGPWVGKYTQLSSGEGDFNFGIGAPWGVQLFWRAGSADPEWARSDDAEVPPDADI